MRERYYRKVALKMKIVLNRLTDLFTLSKDRGYKVGHISPDSMHSA